MLWFYGSKLTSLFRLEHRRTLESFFLPPQIKTLLIGTNKYFTSKTQKIKT